MQIEDILIDVSPKFHLGALADTCNINWYSSKWFSALR